MGHAGKKRDVGKVGKDDSFHRAFDFNKHETNLNFNMEIVFYLTALLLLFSSVMVVTQKSVFTSALYLAVALSMVAALFVLLNADFLAEVQILLYVGGILVLLAFAVMLSSVEQAKRETQVNEQWLPSLMISFGILLVLLVSLKRSSFLEAEIQKNHFYPTTEKIGHLLLGELALPFEVVSLVLLASLVGAILFSKKEKIDG